MFFVCMVSCISINITNRIKAEAMHTNIQHMKYIIINVFV